MGNSVPVSFSPVREQVVAKSLLAYFVTTHLLTSSLLPSARKRQGNKKLSFFPNFFLSFSQSGANRSQASHLLANPPSAVISASVGKSKGT